VWQQASDGDGDGDGDFVYYEQGAGTLGLGLVSVSFRCADRHRQARMALVWLVDGDVHSVSWLCQPPCFVTKMT